MTLRTMFGSYEDCFLTVNKYVADESPAIQIWNVEDGPIATLTVCLDEKRVPLKPNEAYVDVNNLPEAMAFIREYGLGYDTGVNRQSGFSIYPLVAFDMDEVRKHVFAQEGVC